MQKLIGKWEIRPPVSNNYLSEILHVGQLTLAQTPILHHTYCLRFVLDSNEPWNYNDDHDVVDDDDDDDNEDVWRETFDAVSKSLLSDDCVETTTDRCQSGVGISCHFTGQYQSRRLQ